MTPFARRRAVARLVIMASVVVQAAGCLGAGSQNAALGTVAAASENVHSPATFDASTGGIEGVVTSEEALPIVGANVTLAGPGLYATTDGAGGFAFSNVAPGPDIIQVSADGYQPGAAKVVVETEKLAHAAIVLHARPAMEPYALTTPKAGFMYCDVGEDLLHDGSPQSFDFCNTAQTPGRESLVQFTFPRTDGWAGFLSETAWKPSSPSAAQLYEYVAMTTTNTTSKQTANAILPNGNHSGPQAAKTVGLAPLRFTANRTDLDWTYRTTPNLRCGNPDVTCQITAYYGAYAPGATAVVLSQRYDVSFTVFYYRTGVPPSFSALPDS